ncbi:MAG: mechanosensitive ion channel family protein [Armatimonadota bacterium]
MEEIQRWLANPLVARTIAAIIGLTIISVLVRLIRGAVTRYITDSATRYRVRKMVTLAGYFISLLALSLIYRDRLGGLTLYLGLASAGVALALQEVILSVAGWLTIVWGGIYHIGDRVQYAEIKGDVIDISILRTTLMEIGEWVEADLYTGRIVRVPNNAVFRGPVYNYSADFPFVWDQITVPVRYGSDYALARAIFQRLADEVAGEYTLQAQDNWDIMLRRYAIERATLHPMVTLVANDNWVEFTVRYLVDYKKRRTTRDRLYQRVLEEFAQSEERLQFASATQEIVGMPDLSVRMQSAPPPEQQEK